MIRALPILAAIALAGTGPQPVLEVPKPTYAAGERVFFWAGVATDGPLDVEAYREQPCRATILDPDARREVHELPLPMDGDPRRGWKGGMGVPAHETIVGTYRVEVSCGDSVVRDAFRVVPVERLDELQTSFDLEPGCDGDPRDSTVVLRVENDSDAPVIVASPGSLMSNWVSFSAEQYGPPVGCGGFLPPEAMGVRVPGVGEAAYDTLAYLTLDSIGHVVLAPGDERRWQGCLSAGLASCPLRPGPLSVELDATLHVLIGASDSEEGRLGPFRVPVQDRFEILVDEGVNFP